MRSTCSMSVQRPTKACPIHQSSYLAGQDTTKTAAIGDQGAQTKLKPTALRQRLVAGQNRLSRTQGALRTRGSTRTQATPQIQTKCFYQADYPAPAPVSEDETNTQATSTRSQGSTQGSCPSSGQGRSAEYSRGYAEGAAHGFADGVSQASGQAAVGQVLPDFIAALLGGSSMNGSTFGLPSTLAEGLSQRTRQYNTFTIPNQGSNCAQLDSATFPNIPRPLLDPNLTSFMPSHQGYQPGRGNIEHTQFLNIPDLGTPHVGGCPYGSPNFTEACQCMPGQYKFVGCLSPPISLAELQTQCNQRQAEIEALAANRTYTVPSNVDGQKSNLIRAKLMKRAPANMVDQGKYTIQGVPMADRTYTMTGPGHLPANKCPATPMANKTYTIAGLGNSPWPMDQNPPTPIANKTYSIAGPGGVDQNLNSALSTTISGISRVVANLQRTIDSANGELPTDPSELTQALSRKLSIKSQQLNNLQQGLMEILQDIQEIEGIDRNAMRQIQHLMRDLDQTMHSTSNESHRGTTCCNCRERLPPPAPPSTPVSGGSPENIL